MLLMTGGNKLYNNNILNRSCQILGPAEAEAEAEPRALSSKACPYATKLSPTGGRNCYKCQKGGYSPLLVPIVAKSEENPETLEHRKKRFMVRAFQGVSCGILKRYRFRWFVLTESDDAISAHISFGREFHKFVIWLRYYCSDFQYIVVEHRQGDLKRRNWHVLSYGSDMLPVKLMREYWLSHFQSTVTGMAEVKDIGKAVSYLAGYLSSGDKFIRSFSSQGWVFRGWIGLSKRYYRQYSEYPARGDLASLSLMSPGRLATETDWLLNTGYRSSHYEKQNLLPVS